jgi:hypothetical protein
MKWVYALALLAVTGAAQVRAAASDYAFEAVNAEVKAGPGSELAVRTSRTLSQSRALSPENMEAMTAKVAPAVESQPGVYRFKGDLDIAGRWALKLMAKVQGEAETIIGTVNFTAKE